MPMENRGWIPARIRQFAKFLSDSMGVYELAIGGIASAPARVGLVAALNAIHVETEVAYDRHSDPEVARAEALAKIAQPEIEHKFPLLCKSASIVIWASLEGFIRSFLAEWLARLPNAPPVPAIAELSIRYGDLCGAAGIERAYLLISRLDEARRTKFRGGVDRFEGLLECFDLGGAAAAETKKALWELSNVRNVLVHRLDLADRKLIDACPWLGYAVGDMVRVTPSQMQVYFRAAIDYLTDVTNRVSAYCSCHDGLFVDLPS